MASSTTRQPWRVRVRQGPFTRRLAGGGPAAALVVLMGAVIAYVLPWATGISGFWVQPDEMTYVRGAMHIADTARPLFPGDFWWSSPAQLLPLLMAPGYALTGSTTGFDIAHGVQAVVFASTAIPLFLLTRRLTANRWAPVLAAALGVCVPWVVMSASVMTEPVAYAAFAWALLALQVCLDRGDVRGDLAGAAGLALAFSARTQFVVLAPVLLAAVLLHETTFAAADAGGSRVRAAARAIPMALRRHVLLFGAAALGLVVVAILGASNVLGAYAETENRIGLPAGTFSATREMFGAAIVAVGVLPLALTLAWWLLTFARPASRPAHAFAALAAVLLPVLLVSAGVYVIELAAVQDRYTMYAAQILAVGAAMMLADGRRAIAALAVGVAAAAALLATTPFPGGVRGMPTPGRVINDVLDGRFWQLGDLFGFADLGTSAGLAIVTVAGGLVIAAAWAARAPAGAIATVAGAALVLFAAGNMVYTVRAFKPYQANVSEGYREGRDWIDDTLGDRRATGIVGVVFDPVATTQVWWETSTFNHSASSVYGLEPQDLYGQGFADYIDIDGRGRVHDMEQERFVLMSETDARLGLRGARDVKRFNGLVLREVPRPYRVGWALQHPDGEGKVVGGKAGAVRVYGDGRAGRRRVELLFTSSIGSGREYTVSIPGATPERRRVPLGKVARLAVDVQLPVEGSVRIGFRVLDPGGAGAAPEEPPMGVRLAGVRVGSAR